MSVLYLYERFLNNVGLQSGAVGGFRGWESVVKAGGKGWWELKKGLGAKNRPSSEAGKCYCSVVGLLLIAGNAVAGRIRALDKPG